MECDFGDVIIKDCLQCSFLCLSFSLVLSLYTSTKLTGNTCILGTCFHCNLLPSSCDRLQPQNDNPYTFQVWVRYPTTSSPGKAWQAINSWLPEFSLTTLWPGVIASPLPKRDWDSLHFGIVPPKYLLPIFQLQFFFIPWRWVLDQCLQTGVCLETLQGWHLALRCQLFEYRILLLAHGGLSWNQDPKHPPSTSSFKKKIIIKKSI